MKATERRLADCQRVIGYYFSNPDLLDVALTHSSLRAPDRECNERLEFLGDSILGLVVTEELYHLLPDQSEGELTRIKSAVVSRAALLDASLRLGLPQYAEFARGVSRRDKLPARQAQGPAHRMGACHRCGVIHAQRCGKASRA